MAAVETNLSDLNYVVKALSRL